MPETTPEQRVFSVAQQLKGMSEHGNRLTMIGVVHGLQFLATGLYEITPDKLARLLEESVNAANLAMNERAEREAAQ